MIRQALKEPFTLWVLSEPEGEDVLLVVENDDGTRRPPVLARSHEEVRRVLTTFGMPTQIVANSRAAVRFVREADRTLFQVSADLLPSKDLSAALLGLLFALHRS